MKVRILSILLVLCFLIALPACTSKDAGPSNPTTAAASSGSAPAEDKNVLPYKGDEVTISMLGWASYKDLEPETLFGKWFQEKLGKIKLDIEIPVADDAGMTQKCDLYLASGDMPDIMVYRDAEKFMRAYGDGSVTLNLLDYAKYMPEYTERRKTFPHLSWFDKDNKAYLFFPSWYDGTSETWFQNQDLMTKYNLKTPTNYDELLQCLDTVKKGEPKNVGLLFHGWGFEYQYTCFSQLFGSLGRSPGTMVFDYNKNKWVFALKEYSDIYYNATKAMADAYAKGFIAKDFITMPGDVWTNTRNNGDYLFTFLYNNISKSDYESTYIAKPVYIDPPAATGVKPSVRTDYTSDVVGWGYVISKKAKNPELCASILDLIGSKETANTYYWGWEGDTYKVNAEGKKEYNPDFLKLPKEDSEKKYGIMTYPYVFMPMFSMCYAGDAVMSSWSDESRRGTEIASKKLKSGEYETYYGASNPTLSDDATEKYGTLSTAVRTYVNETLTAFVLGSKNLSGWDAFVNSVKDYGDIDWAVEQFNAAPQKPAKALQSQRNYITP